MQPTKEHTGDIMHGTPLLIEVCVDSVESAIAFVAYNCHFFRYLIRGVAALNKGELIVSSSVQT